MRSADHADFRTLMANVHAFYRQDMSEFALDVWWNAMRQYDFAAVRQALGRHTVNPDTGQFMPKPADVVKMLAGRTVDSAQVAWSKVDRAVRSVGPYQSVVFDDALIHRVIEEMGGWTALGRKAETEWPFVAKEFENRYRGYTMRSERPEYQAVLVGTFESDNGRLGHEIAPPVLIGDRDAALAVMRNGSLGGLLGISTAKTEELVAHAAKRLASRPSDGVMA